MPGPATISPRRSLAAALLAGALHGPAEALPISSSAHVAFVARLAAGRRGRRPVDPEIAKSVEVGAHAGTLAGLALGLRREAVVAAREALRNPRRSVRAAARIGVATLPSVVGALTLERPIERRLGGDTTIAYGLAVGSLAMAVADRSGATAGRHWSETTLTDALLVGTAQAAALWPGVSRSGAVLAAARTRGFSRAASGQISAALAVPVVGGATLLKLVRLTRRLQAGTIAPERLVPLLAVTTTSAASGYAAAPLARRSLDGVALWPFAVYRLGLAAALAVTAQRWRH